MKTFTFNESRKNAWEIYKKNWEIILISFVAAFILSILIPAKWFGLNIITSTIVTVLITKLSIVLFESKKADVSDLKFTSPEVVEIVKTLILFWIVSIGAILFIGIISGIALLAGFLVGSLTQLAAPWVLGFIFAGVIGFVLFIWIAIRASFISVHIVKNAHHKGSWNTIKQGWNMTNGHVGTIIMFGINALLLNLLGLVALVVGLLITVPLTQIIKIDLYHKLLNKNHE